MQVVLFLKRRFILPFKEFSWFLRIATVSLFCLLSYGLIFDSVKYGNREGVILSVILSVVFTLMIIEAVTLFEFRAVDLFNYGSDRKSELRDKWLGKFIIRGLLILGNAAILIKLINQ